MAIKLDKYDMKILYLLDVNAKIPTSQIAKKIRKSKQFVDYRIKKLEENKVILGYNTIIDYSRLGYISIRVYFRFQNITPEEQRALEDDLAKDDEVWQLVTAEGNVDLGYATAVKNVLDFYPYWDKIMLKYKRYVAESTIVFYSHIRQFPRAFLIGKKNQEIGTLIGASNELDIKDIEIRLLKILSTNAKLSNIELGQKLNISRFTVKKHIQRLEKIGVIQGYRALIDASHLGYRYYKAYINFNSTKRLKELEQFCLEHPNMLNLNRTIGGSDFEIELQAKSFEQFEDIMDELRTIFAGMIKDYTFVIAKEEKKMNYFPFDIK